MRYAITASRPMGRRRFSAEDAQAAADAIKALLRDGFAIVSIIGEDHRLVTIEVLNSLAEGIASPGIEGQTAG